MRAVGLFALLSSGAAVYACGATGPAKSIEGPDASAGQDAGADAGGSPRDAAEADVALSGASCVDATTPCNLAPDSVDTEGLFVNGTSVFFTERRPSGAVRRVGVVGGVVTTLATSPMPSSVGGFGGASSACGSHDYTSPSVVAWISEGPPMSLHQVTLSSTGAVPGITVPVSGAGRVLGEFPSLVWSSPDADTITSQEVACGTSTMRYTSPAPGSPLAMASANGGFFFWAEHSSAGQIHKGLKVEVQGGTDGGAGSTYANIEAIAGSKSTVAWTSASGVFATKPDTASFTNPAAVELIDPATDGRGIVVDGDVVYYLAGGELRAKTRGTGDSPTTLTKICAGYRWLEQNAAFGEPGARSLFWTCGADGGVFRLAKPAP